MGMMTLAGLSLVALSGCGKGSEFDKAFKEEGRKQYVEQCVSQATKRIPEGVDIDLNSLCGCAADKTFTEDEGAMDIVKKASDMEAQMANMQACMQEAGIPVPGAEAAPAAE